MRSRRGRRRYGDITLGEWDRFVPEYPAEDPAYEYEDAAKEEAERRQEREDQRWGGRDK